MKTGGYIEKPKNSNRQSIHRGIRKLSPKTHNGLYKRTPSDQTKLQIPRKARQDQLDHCAYLPSIHPCNASLVSIPIHTHISPPNQNAEVSFILPIPCAVQPSYRSKLPLLDLSPSILPLTLSSRMTLGI